MNGSGTMHGPHTQVTADAVVAVFQREFPTEFRVCVQAAYIEQLEARLSELSRDEMGG